MAQNPDPSPAEIAELCLLIQAGWSPEERMRRLRADLRPTYQRCDSERLEMSSDVYDRHHEQRAELQEAD
jgi:hypothetical protein